MFSIYREGWGRCC